MNHYETQFLARERIADRLHEAEQERLARAAHASRQASSRTSSPPAGHGRSALRVALAALIHIR